MDQLPKSGLKRLTLGCQAHEELWAEYSAKYPNRSRNDMMDEPDGLKKYSDKIEEIKARETAKAA